MGTDEATMALTAVVLAWAAWRRRWVWILAVGISLGVTDPLVSRVIKPAIGRERPCRALPDVATPNGCGAALAMPSGHAANTAALATVSASPVLAGVSVVVGVSRIVNGQHWPSDVVVGWIVGGAIGGAVGSGVRAGVGRIAARRARKPDGARTGGGDGSWR